MKAVFNKLYTIFCRKLKKSRPKKHHDNRSIKLSGSKNDIGLVLYSGWHENNFIADLDFAARCFLEYGIPSKNIYAFAPSHVFTTSKDDGTFLGEDWGLKKDHSEFLTSFENFRQKYMFFVFTGHGDHNGIVDNTKGSHIRSGDLFRQLETTKDIEFANFLFGPCFSGVYNWSDTYSCKCKVSMIGATGEGSSILHPVVQGNPIDFNVFLYFFHQWIANLEDIDGDGGCSLLDAYKYAAIKTNQHTSTLYAQNHAFISLNAPKYLEMQVKASQNTLDLNQKAELDSLGQQINHMLMILYCNQQPWHLNANQIRNVTF